MNELKYYGEEYDFHDRVPRFEKTLIQMSDGDSFTVASHWQGHMPGILNFASHKRPGGGYKAVQDLPMPIKTQEEDLFRRSDLPLIMDTEDVRRRYYPLKGKAGIYCETSITKDARLRPCKCFKVGIITVPAVVNPQPEDKGLVEAKARRVLEIAADRHLFDLILGAWGCGIFNNDPVEIASIFKRLLANEFNGHFDRVVFAIPGAGSNNYKLFEQTLLG